MALKQIFFALGLNSNTFDNKHIIMLDYDISDICTIRQELIECQDRFRLSNFYIVKSNTGFNAFCLDKLLLYNLKMIFEKLPNVDKNFKEMTIKRGYGTIRIGTDKKYCLTLQSIHSEKEKSLAHKNALKLYYNMPIFDVNNFDCLKSVTLCQYENYKYGADKPYNNVEFEKRGWI